MKTYPLPTIQLLPDAIILANGDYPVHPLPVSLLEKSDYVVCCDGAANAFMRTGKVPVAIVGDGDSLSDENHETFSHLIHTMADQETNDQTKAFQYCTEHHKNDIFILGATGKREDHTLGNISLLADYIEQASVSMLTDYGVFTPVAVDSLFECLPGQQISIFALEPAEITVSGLLYPINKRILTNWWQGTLNEATGNCFAIYTTGKVVVFRAYL